VLGVPVRGPVSGMCRVLPRRPSSGNCLAAVRGSRPDGLAPV